MLHCNGQELKTVQFEQSNIRHTTAGPPLILGAATRVGRGLDEADEADLERFALVRISAK